MPSLGPGDSSGSALIQMLVYFGLPLAALLKVVTIPAVRTGIAARTRPLRDFFYGPAPAGADASPTTTDTHTSPDEPSADDTDEHDDVIDLAIYATRYRGPALQLHEDAPSQAPSPGPQDAQASTGPTP